MNYIILIIVGIAGVVFGTYFGRRRPPATLSRSEGGQGKAEKEGLIRQAGKTGKHVYYEQLEK